MQIFFFDLFCLHEYFRPLHIFFHFNLLFKIFFYPCLMTFLYFCNLSMLFDLCCQSFFHWFQFFNFDLRSYFLVSNRDSHFLKNKSRLFCILFLSFIFIHTFDFTQYNLFSLILAIYVNFINLDSLLILNYF